MPTPGPKLRLHRADDEQSDIIPFPGRDARERSWRPRQPDLAIAGVEDALEDVARRLATLDELLQASDDDRPRAA